MYAYFSYAKALIQFLVTKIRNEKENKCHKITGEHIEDLRSSFDFFFRLRSQIEFLLNKKQTNYGILPLVRSHPKLIDEFNSIV